MLSQCPYCRIVQRICERISSSLSRCLLRARTKWTPLHSGSHALYNNSWDNESILSSIASIVDCLLRYRYCCVINEQSKAKANTRLGHFPVCFLVNGVPLRGGDDWVGDCSCLASAKACQRILSLMIRGWRNPRCLSAFIGIRTNAR